MVGLQPLNVISLHFFSLTLCNTTFLTCIAASFSLPYRYVQPGDEVHEFDTICQVQSDKATVDITSRYHGVVTSLGAPVGEMIQVGTPLLFLQTDGASPHINVAEPSSTDNAKSSPTNTRSSSLADQMAADAASSRQDERLRIPSIASHYDLEDDASGASPRKVLTSPAVRKLAADHQIDLHTIKGTGPSGRILKYDVVQYLRQQGLMDSGVEGTVAATMKPSLPTPSTLPPSTILSEPEIIELKGYHRYMVQTMTQALQIPHMTLGDEVILDEILALRKRLGDKNDDTSPNISILAFMLKACSLALSEFPILNASIHSLERCELKIHREHHLGVAMDTPRGLVVPAVQNVQAKSLVEIQAELDQLKQHARIGQIDASVLNPTFTLSNVGALGVGQTMSAVLATPQVAMGAVGRLQRVPRFVSPDALDVQAVHVANVSWTGDHRVLDGATLAKFHKSFAAFLQDPVQMLVHTR